MNELAIKQKAADLEGFQSGAHFFRLRGLGIYNMYFVLKLVAHTFGWIEFAPLENLILATLVIVGFNVSWLEKAYDICVGLLAFILIFLESPYRNFDEIIAMGRNIQSFTRTYWQELAVRAFSIDNFAHIFVAFLLYQVVKRYLRMSLIIGSLLIYAAFFDGTIGTVISKSPSKPPIVEQNTAISASSADDPEGWLNKFYTSEAQKQVRFLAQSKDAVPFDIVFLSICSLAWDDLRKIGESENQVLKEFDIVLSDFNAVTSYSGPAIIRLLSGNCGQKPHSDLYNQSEDSCYLAHQLQTVGYQTELALNHNGAFGGFMEDINVLGKYPGNPINIDSLATKIIGFDGSSIKGDFDVLQSWLQSRSNRPTPRVALLYNSITLHDGNKLVGNAALDSQSSYGVRAKALLSDIQQFKVSLSKSDHNTVLVLIPEHGAALGGDHFQMPGIREIPSPTITKVPVAIKLIGSGWKDLKRQPLVVGHPTSFVSLNEILRYLIAADPFASSSHAMSLANAVINLTPVETVSENSNATVAKIDKTLYVKVGKAPFVPYPTTTTSNSTSPSPADSAKSSHL